MLQLLRCVNQLGVGKSNDKACLKQQLELGNDVAKRERSQITQRAHGNAGLAGACKVRQLRGAVQTRQR